MHGGGDVQAAIAEDVKDNRVVVYMKGTPDAPRCGFSNIVVQILNHQGVDFKAHDVLASEVRRKTRESGEGEEGRERGERRRRVCCVYVCDVNPISNDDTFEERETRPQ